MDETGCRICGNLEGNRIFAAREMMFGYRDEFHYLACANCGCLNLIDVPDDMGEYYPSQSYYSFQTARHGNALENFVKQRRMKAILSNRSPLGKLFLWVFKGQDHHLWLKELCVGLDARIIDVGCGDGALLLRLQREGFENLEGIDPYLDRDFLSDHVRILKQDLREIHDRVFDIVLFNHSLEHLREPLDALIKARGLLAEKGACIIATPLADSYACRKYGSNWVQIDPPRHIHVFSRKGLELMAEHAGLVLRRTIFNSNEFQFWGSEQYERNIPLRAGTSDSGSRQAGPGGKRDMKRYRKMAGELNKRDEGDQAIFIFGAKNRGAL